MRTHTSEFKEELKVFGRQMQGKITYYPSYDLVSESEDNILTEADLQIISEQANYNDPIEISEEDIFSISIIKNGDLLQSLMKEFDFETKVELNIGSVVNPQFGLLVNEDYEYLDYGNYIINSKEFNMDTETWSYVCYDKMLFSMVKYRGLSNVQYPITIKQFINKLCDKVGLEFEDGEFVNQDQLIYEDLYKNRDVTYRDIFDEISKVVAGNLLINDSDKLEVGYPNKASYSENATGSDISIEAEEEKILNVKLEGNIYQKEYNGINLMPNNKNSGTSKGITYTANEDGTYLLSGQNTTTSNSAFYIYRGDLFINSGTYYVIPTGDSNVTITLYVTYEDNNKQYKDISTNSTITINKNVVRAEIYVQVRKGSAKNYNKFKVYPMLSTTPVTKEDYEPYVGGSISPSPDYPQDIKVVTGEQNVEIVGKNLFDKDNPNIFNGYPDYGALVSWSSHRILWIPCNSNTTYTVKKINQGSNKRFGLMTTIEEPAAGVPYASLVRGNNENNLTITTGENAKYLLIWCYVTNDTQTTWQQILDSIQIEQGTTATEYQPYQEQNYLIDLGNIELCKIGNYQDSIYYNSNWYYSNLFTKIESYNGETITTPYISTTGGLDIGATIYYYNSSNTPIQITDTTLMQQLNNLKNATLYSGTNNINVSGELPVILNLDYISEYESINEDYLKDTNVRMSEKIGVINSVAILDSESNLQFVAEDTQSIKENQMTRVTITDNLIAMNGETQEIADNILNKLNGLYYYANDLQTTGVCYYDFLDMFNVEARGNVYQCLLLNNEITITQGIEEHIFTERFEELETQSNEYTTSVMTNKQIQFNINQQEGKIESKVEKDGVISAINQSAEEIQINADKLSFEGATINMTADNVKIKGDNLEIDSDGTITLYDNSATSSLNPETLHSAYIIKSTDTVERAGTTETLSFKNEIVANGRRITLEDNWEYQGTTGGGKAGIIEGVYSQPRLKFYAQSNDYDPSYSSGSYQDLDISLNAGISYTNINNGASTTPLKILPNGDITCVRVIQTSKEENKKNFERLINAKDILNQVDIYKYNFKDEDDNVKKSIGFVIGDDFNYSQEITSENNDGANIYSMVSVLWQVVKEYSKIVDNQQKEINELKEMIKNGKY